MGHFKTRFGSRISPEIVANLDHSGEICAGRGGGWAGGNDNRLLVFKLHAGFAFFFFCCI